MPLPRRTASKKAQTPAASTAPDPLKDATVTDEFGIVYLGDSALVRVSMDVKLSRNYNSLGASAALEFRTPLAGLDETVKKALQKVRKCMKDEVEVISDALDNL